MFPSLQLFLHFNVTRFHASLISPSLASFLPSHTTQQINSHLSLLLASAERAWSRAQEAKLALESGPDMSKKRVLLSRSAKAASWGRELAAAASAAGDSRTTVEAAAYSSWLEGLAAMERAPGAGKRGGDGSSVVDAAASVAAWSSALEALARAGELCSRLAASSAGFGGENTDTVSSSPADARAAARAQAAGIAPLVRFCQHQLGRASASGEEDPERIAAAAAEGAGAASGPEVKAALEELRAWEGKDDDEGDDDDSTKKERTSSSAAAASSTFSWRGSSFAVPSERARSALASAQAALADARKDDDDDDVARLAALDRALAAFGDAKGIVRQQQQQAEGGVTTATAAPSSSSADAARAAADAHSLTLVVTGAALDAALERGRLAASLLSRALDGGEKEAATILKVKQAALVPSAAATETTANPSTSDAAAASEKKKRQQCRRAAAAAKRPPRPEDAVRAYTSLVKTAKQLGEVAAALGGTTGELLLDEAAAVGADASARRTFWAARTFLASRRCADAMALLDRARQRAEAAAEAHEECSRPDRGAISSLRSLAEDACPGWRAVAHAEAAARTARGIRAAGAKVAGLKVAAGGGGGSGKKKRRVSGGDDDDDDGDDDEEEREKKRPFLMERLDEWASCAPIRIAPIPPRLEIVPVRPFVLDVAFDGVVPPDVSRRVGKADRVGSSVRASSRASASASASASAASEEESAGTLSKLVGAFGWGSK